MPSSIGPARAYLHDALRVGVAPISMIFGLPSTIVEEEQEVVAMLGIEGPSEDPAAFGNRRRQEVYDILVGVKVHQPDGTRQTVDARGFEIIDMVRNVALDSAHNTLGGHVLWCGPAAVRTDGVTPVEQGYVMFADVPIRCHARV